MDSVFGRTPKIWILCIPILSFVLSTHALLVSLKDEDHKDLTDVNSQCHSHKEIVLQIFPNMFTKTNMGLSDKHPFKHSHLKIMWSSYYLPVKHLIRKCSHNAKSKRLKQIQLKQNSRTVGPVKAEDNIGNKKYTSFSS